MSTLPPLRPIGSCNGGSSSAGQVPIEEGLTLGEAACIAQSPAGKIIGGCPAGLCDDTGGEVLAGVAVAAHDNETALLQITGEVDPGPGPYADPIVTSVVAGNGQVAVTWGPTNNDASISLELIAAAIAATPDAEAILTVIPCGGAGQFLYFVADGGSPIITITSDTVQNQTYQVTADSPAVAGIALVDTSVADINMALPPAAWYPNIPFTFRRINGANSVILLCDGTETIDGVGVYTTTGAVQIVSDGSKWHSLYGHSPIPPA